VNRRLAAITAVVALASFAASGPSRVKAQQPVFRARTDVVSVSVSVMKGREPVIGLGAADFELTDNGVRQTVDAVSLEHVPIDLTLVLTQVPLDRPIGEQGLNLASAETTRQRLLPADRLRVIWVDEEVRGGLVGTDYSVLTDATPEGWTGGFAFGNGFKMFLSPGTKHGWGLALFDGLFYALAWPVDADRRHLVVAFTDGWDTGSTLEMETLPRLAAHSDAVLHAVFWATPADGPGSGGAMSTPNPSREWQASYHAVDEAVQRTGGTLQRTSRASEALAAIIANFRSSYVLRYTPRGVPPAGWHELRVKVTRPGSFSVRARKGYEGG
jgi:hypothetical protein